MKPDDCYQLGEVVKTHGLRGEVSMFIDADFPEEYEELESVFLLQHGKPVPFFIESIQINGNKALVKFEDVDSIESAAEIVKTKILLPLSSLPKLSEGGYYFHQLIGCKVYENDILIGEVQSIIDLNGNELLVIQEGEKEILIPMKDEILMMVDVSNKKIEVKLPDGLLDLYN